MIDLIMRLDEIVEVLEQINGITTNQTTIMLEGLTNKADEEQMEEVLEEMGENKKKLIDQVDKMENDFEEAYNLVKATITNKEDIEQLKSKVSKILEIKKAILDNEKSNMIIMQSKMRQESKVVTIPKDPRKVIETYKNNSLKGMGNINK